MSAISTWSTTAANNNSAAPNGAPENTFAPSDVNDTIREMMAQVRTWYENAAWTDLGHTPTFASSTSFTVATDLTSTYTTNRRIKIDDSSTLYGTISSSSFSSPNTTVNVTLDSGSITGSISAVHVSILNPTNSPINSATLSDSASIPTLSANNAFTGNNTVGGTFGVTGATTLSSTLTVSGVATFNAAPVVNAANAVFNYDSDGVNGFDVILRHSSDSPANNDIIGFLDYQSKDSGASLGTHGRIDCVMNDVTAASEDSSLRLQTVVAGTLSNRVLIGNGMYSASTNTDQGNGTINFSGIYDDNVQIYPLGSTVSSPALTSGTTYQNTSGKYEYIHAYGSNAVTAYVECDSGSPPTTVVDRLKQSTNDEDGMFILVPPNYYYRFTISTGSLTYVKFG